MADMTQLLNKLGFTDYEARAYIKLVGAGAKSGYEVAKLAGMPRANVYPVLEKLVERGAAQRQDTPKGKRYTAVPPKQFLQQLRQQHQQTLDQAEQALSALEQHDQAKPVFNLEGYNELLTQAQGLINQAETELLVGIQPHEASALADVLRQARERGVKITNLCMESCPAGGCGGCQGDIYHCYAMPDQSARWLLLVGDGQQALAGEIRQQAATAIATEHRQIIELISAFIRQSLSLSLLSDNLGERFDGLLSELTKQTLQPS